MSRRNTTYFGLFPGTALPGKSPRENAGSIFSWASEYVPLGDTGGDHDLYEYCVDDPVTMNDPTGLLPPLVAGLGALLLAAGGGYAVPRGIVAAIDWKQGSNHGAEMDKKALPPTAAAVGAGAALTGLFAAPEAVFLTTTLARHAGAAVLNNTHRIVQAAPHVGNFIEGAVLPGPPPMTGAGIGGYATRQAYDAAKKGR